MMRLSKLFGVCLLLLVQNAAVHCDGPCNDSIIKPGAIHGLCGRVYEEDDERDWHISRPLVTNPDYLLRRAIKSPSGYFSCVNVGMGAHKPEIMWCCTRDNYDDSIVPTSLTRVRRDCFTF
ncbi:hypothetical protein Pst134EA_026976 [Puccinia striiformis f. sp. tritici]|uniref:hypothetical protein n=1 Tax=Puccinia striiformis f. sp. tritici TaxID=168172 RepID=UPI00200771DC|nr:hypothetical protein Pst134EA_026976 [Puccinia striiformis f. sp. tritici]KAH9450270.1 hypothetical protein Pst134EA_026976 [Puccinia striiformis f. sp. tritici]